ncbi:ATP-dependent DNA helicase [Haloferax namakaokahaiae]|uniref:ATP-dependent DNA helicase n=1 Tax=Haloferax namakaokahaiae TaxID=1748331 RepID=A0ABD5ZF81_9EURY
MAVATGPETVTWQEVFGHAEPYPEQADGIETALSTARDGGFTVIEGACGTGKTMLALTAGIELVRDPDSDYERVFVLTSVKQQLRQFEADLRTINENLPDEWKSVSGLTLVGKADVCPYSRETCGGIDESTVYDRCDGLRDRTRGLVGDGGMTSAEALAKDAREQQTGLLDTGATQTQPSYLETAGEPTPYPKSMPDYEDVEYCPFYANYLADLPEDGDPIEAVPFDFDDMGLITTNDLVGLSAGMGSCPHSVMGALLSHVEVVIGNYYHAFDPTTVGTFTGALVDDSTYVICDEAHMLEPRVRDLVSVGVGDKTLRDAESELTRVIQPVEFEDAGKTTADAEVVKAELSDADVTLRELKETREFVRDLREELDRRVTAHLDGENRHWRSNLTELSDAEIPLRDPEEPSVDELTEWAESEGYDDGTWVRAEATGSIVGRILNSVEEEDKRRAAPAAGRALATWAYADHESYFRAIDLERTWNEMEPAESWRRAYNAQLSVHNCLPGDAIAERMGDFGGGVLMSATLEPLDVFRSVAGLDALEADGRPVAERTFGLGFPEENRESFAVDVPKYTHQNRGAPGEENSTRLAYTDATAEVCTRSPGNVLVGMPNYAEAEWMAGVLSERIDKPVLLDEASDDGVTEDLKHEFFGGESKVLVTSLRGTLTEGVDYRGDRLSAAVVCGVPLINTASPRTRAVKTAYDKEFGDGFETALTVPAVRKARQAIGRVIRGTDEVGVRVFVDARYARESWDGVRQYFPDHEREEFQPVSSDMLGFGLERFWSSVE